MLYPTELRAEMDAAANSFFGQIAALLAARNPHAHKCIAVYCAPIALHFVPKI
jgi:hypothetical protein